ncbi:MAG: DUF4332 domain-containing protein [Synechococcales cyanobacterium RM1_1_8]|nr:DUF4332 domain-containing protein [Synechococcales cyanobacterium RM1_1_8]
MSSSRPISLGSSDKRSPQQLPQSSALASQNWAIAQLPGLSAADQAKLQAGGIGSTLELLGQAQNPSQRTALAQRLGLRPADLGKWVALSDLARVPGVGCNYCGLLLHSGIGSVAHLAGASAHQLYPQVMRLYVAMLRRRDLTPTVSQVAQWILRAKQLLRSGADIELATGAGQHRQC